MGVLEHFWAVVPAGGAGTRLWPLSRRAEPKFLLDLTGSGRTLLQATVDRLVPLTGDRVLVVTGRGHRDAVLAQLAPLPAEAVLAEPAPRDSMAAIGLAAALIERRDPDAVMGSFAADHVITDPEAFATCVRRAEAAARDGWLVTSGGRLLTTANPASSAGLATFTQPLAVGGSVVLVVHADEARLRATYAAERATAAAGPRAQPTRL